MPAATPAPVDPLDAAAAKVEADDAKLQADIADLAKLDAPSKPRRKSDTPAPEEPMGDSEPGPDHPLRMPAQWTHPLGPWGDAPAQSRFN